MTGIAAVSVDGYTGKITFDGETIHIERPGLKGKIGYSNKPSKIDVSEITRIAFEPANLMKNGTITFLTSGHVMELSASDPNSVIFTRKQSKDFTSLKTAIEQATDIKAHQVNPGTATYDGHTITDGMYTAFSKRKDAIGATATFDSGSDSSRPTLTRIGAGALLAGPVGAIAGSLFKKNSTKNYVTIVFHDGDSVIIEGPRSDEKKMRQFVANFNRLAA